MVADIAVVTTARPHRGEVVSGDACVVTRHEGRTRLALIDGLGHGIAAAAAAAVAREVLEAEPHLGPIEAILACHRPLKATRGAVVGIAQVGDGFVEYAGVGNIEGGIWSDGSTARFSNTRGIVGGTLASPRSVSFDLHSRWLLVLHSDGLRRGLELPYDILDGLDEVRAQALADQMVETWGRATDDATVLLAWPKA